MMPAADPYPTEKEIAQALAEGITIRQLRDRQLAAPARRTARAKTPVPELPQLEPGQLRITVPMPPDLTNRSGKSRNQYAVAAEKKAFYAHLDQRLMARLLTPAPTTPFAAARLAATLYLGHAMDEDNAMARCKWPIDWLVTRGYLADDDRARLRWQGQPDQVIQRGQEYRITFTLTPG